MSDGVAVWEDAVLAAALIAVDPAGLGGARVHGWAGPVRDRWLSIFQGLLPAEVRVRKLPPAISAGRLLGGIDLASTLQTVLLTWHCVRKRDAGVSRRR